MKKDTAVFAYPYWISALSFIVACFMIVTAIVAIQKGESLGLFGVLGGGEILFLIISGIYLQSYKIRLARDALYVASIFQRKTVRFSLVDNIVVYKGLKTNWVDLKCQNKVLYRVRDTIADYTTFVREVVNVLGKDVSIVAKDKYGNERRVRSDLELDEII